jgi:hypothetical protein
MPFGKTKDSKLPVLFLCSWLTFGSNLVNSIKVAKLETLSVQMVKKLKESIFRENVMTHIKYT